MWEFTLRLHSFIHLNIIVAVSFYINKNGSTMERVSLSDSMLGLPSASVVWSTLWSSGGLASSCCQPVELGGWRMGRDTGMFMGREQVLGWVAAETGSCWMASSASWRASTAFGVAIALTGSSEWVSPSLHRLQLLFSHSEFTRHCFIYFRLHIF